MKPRRVGDPWYTVFYRDPHTLWWVPAAIVAPALFLGYVTVFDRSVVYAFGLATVFGLIGGAGNYYRWRSRNRHQ